VDDIFHRRTDPYTVADEIVARLRRARGRWALSNPNFEKLLRVVIDVKKGA
jgi:hypothetical protein